MQIITCKSLFTFAADHFQTFTSDHLKARSDIKWKLFTTIKYLEA